MAECARFERKVVTTEQVDPAAQVVGSSPYAGDYYATGLVLPPFPTDIQDGRYLTRLCGVDIDEGSRCIIRSLRQLLTIGAEVPSETPGLYIPVELDVVSPTWNFINGNVSWHLRMVNPRVPAFTRTFVDVPPFTLPFSGSLDGTTASILTRREGPPSYLPLNGGVPYGDPVHGLGTFRDIRYPWSQSAEPANLGIEVLGPGQLVLFASVYQPNPATRPALPVPLPDLSVLRPEDAFVFRYPDARYWRIGAEMVIDLCNPTE
jgi:hypothetical protein